MNTTETKFTIRVTTAPGTNASAIGESYAGHGCSWRNSIDRCDSDGCGRVFLDCEDEATHEFVCTLLENDDSVTRYDASY